MGVVQVQVFEFHTRNILPNRGLGVSQVPPRRSWEEKEESRPWHGPYRVIERKDPDITVVRIYGAVDKQIQVHQYLAHQNSLQSTESCTSLGRDE